MKKFALLFAMMLMSTTFFAQEHLDFRGVPIDGHVDNFIAKMKELGYALDENSDGVAIMEGKFIGKDVNLFIVYTPKTNIVWKVGVFFDKATSWSSIKSDYREYKELYKTKYGEGKSYEFFSKPYYEGDGYEMQAVRKEKCRYTTFFECTAGNITVEISSNERILISYEDAINVKLNRSEKTSSALDQI